MGHVRPSHLIVTLAVLMLGSAVAAQEWSLPDSRLNVRTAPILLLSRADIQAELGVTAEQTRSLMRVVSDLRDRAAGIKGVADVDAIVARREIDKAESNWIETQLNDAQQARLLQVDLQWEGVAALISRPWVANSLGLSSVQRKQIAEEVARAHAQLDDSAHPNDAESVLAGRVMPMLNRDQYAQWKALLGKPIALRAQTARVDVDS